MDQSDARLCPRLHPNDCGVGVKVADHHSRRPPWKSPWDFLQGGCGRVDTQPAYPLMRLPAALQEWGSQMALELAKVGCASALRLYGTDLMALPDGTGLFLRLGHRPSIDRWKVTP